MSLHMYEREKRMKIKEKRDLQLPMNFSKK